MPILLLIFLLPHLGMWAGHPPMAEPGTGELWNSGLSQQCWVCCSPIKVALAEQSPLLQGPAQAGPLLLRQFSQTPMRLQQFFLGGKGSGISVLLMECNYLMLSPGCSLPELGFSRHSIMAVIARGSLAGAGAARCNGTLL